MGFQRGSVVRQWLKPATNTPIWHQSKGLSPGYPASHSASCPCIPWQTATSVWVPDNTWETQTEFWASGFSLALHWLLCAFGK